VRVRSLLVVAVVLGFLTAACSGDSSEKTASAIEPSDAETTTRDNTPDRTSTSETSATTRDAITTTTGSVTITTAEPQNSVGFEHLEIQVTGAELLPSSSEGERRVLVEIQALNTSDEVPVPYGLPELKLAAQAGTLGGADCCRMSLTDPTGLRTEMYGWSEFGSGFPQMPGMVSSTWAESSQGVPTANLSEADIGTLTVTSLWVTGSNQWDERKWEFQLPRDISTQRFVPSIPQAPLTIGDSVSLQPRPWGGEQEGADPQGTLMFASVSKYQPANGGEPVVRLTAAWRNDGNVEISCTPPIRFMQPTSTSGHSFIFNPQILFIEDDGEVGVISRCNSVAPGSEEIIVYEFRIVPSFSDRSEAEIPSLDMSAFTTAIEVKEATCIIDCPEGYDGETVYFSSDVEN
jgi:hypothetical protein